MISRRQFVLRACVCCVGGAVANTGYAQIGDPRIGIWHLNVAKSHFDPGPALKSLTVKVEATGDGDGEKVINEWIDEDGARFVMQYNAYFDGRDYWLTGFPLFDSVALKRIDARTTERIDKKRGQVVRTLTRAISEDGKTMTVRIRGKDSMDRDVRDILVFEKQ